MFKYFLLFLTCCFIHPVFASKWISLKDQLPPENTKVLTYALNTYAFGTLNHGIFKIDGLSQLGVITSPVYWQTLEHP